MKSIAIITWINIYIHEQEEYFNKRLRKGLKNQMSTLSRWRQWPIQVAH